jgi:antitoxin (DNA-binding transcriptional repressor) of toxin-antitoxin stability system
LLPLCFKKNVFCGHCLIVFLILDLQLSAIPWIAPSLVAGRPDRVANIARFYVCFTYSLWMSMTTMTPTEARANLSSVLRRVLQGADIGIVCNGRIIALRPVEVEATDYAVREYDVSERELERFARRANEEIQKDRKAGSLREFTGDIEDLVKG